MTSFFDTNVVLYAQQAGVQGSAARACLSKGGFISVQVLNEFTNVARRKFGMKWNQIRDAVDDVLVLLNPPIAITDALFFKAMELAETSKISFFDSLIVAAALSAECKTLFSEDLQDGRQFGALQIVNPFKSST